MSFHFIIIAIIIPLLLLFNINKVDDYNKINTKKIQICKELEKN